MKNAAISVSNQRISTLLAKISKDKKAKGLSNYKKIAPKEVAEVCRRLHITRAQAVILTTIIDGERLSRKELAENLGCGVIDLYVYNDEIACLVGLDMIEQRYDVNHSGFCFEPTDDFLQAVALNADFDYSSNLSKVEISCSYLLMQYLRFKDGQITHEELQKEVCGYLEGKFYRFRKVDCPNHLRTFAAIAMAFIFRHEGSMLSYSDISALCSKREYGAYIKLLESNADFALYFEKVGDKLKLKEWNPTPEDMAYKEYLEKLDGDSEEEDEEDDSEEENDEDDEDDPFGLFVNNVKPQKMLTLIKHDSIKPMEMYYNESNKHEIIGLADLLAEARYNQVRERLDKAGMRRGFTIALHGTPGTGKTETVKQLARETGRDILQVDISQIRGMYVGDNERNMRQVFKEYAEHLKASQIHPILLFNEADSLLGARLESGSLRSADKGENAMQNILLQELEDFEGILIATTNLPSNFDKAFERRFLYKLKLDNPTAEVRAKIWVDKIEGLDPMSALHLAEKYNFSGGQIENIARKVLINQVLDGTEALSYEALSSMCESEVFLKTVSRKSVGFIA